MPSRRLFDGAQEELGILPIVGGVAPPSTQTVTQTARFDNAQTFYGGTVSLSGGTQTITQTARFDNANQFYPGTVSQVSGAQTVTQTSRFDNANAFYAGVVSQTGGVQTITQSSRFDNTPVFYGGVVNGGDQPSGADTHDGYFHKLWRKMAEREKEKRETIDELEEELAEIEAEIVQIKSALVPDRPIVLQSVPIPPIEARAQIIEALIRQAAKIRQEIEDEEETLLLLL